MLHCVVVLRHVLAQLKDNFAYIPVVAVLSLVMKLDSLKIDVDSEMFIRTTSVYITLYINYAYNINCIALFYRYNFDLYFIKHSF